MGHWYTEDGEPMYQVPYANGKGMRDTTLGDAKKLRLMKSVTTVLGLQDKPGLTTWLQQQTLKAVWENPPRGEYKDWCQRISLLSKSVGKAAAERGNAIHDQLEKYYTDGVTKEDPFIKLVIEFMHAHFPGVNWISEESFASKKHRFGGRIDLYSPEGIVLDFKTKDTADVKKMVAFDDHHMQTAAYAVGLAEHGKFNEKSTLKFSPGTETAPGNVALPRHVKRFNLFISTHTPGLITLTESTNFDRDWEMFYTLNKFWELKNNFGDNNVK